jgi:hypothetical protein
VKQTSVGRINIEKGLSIEPLLAAGNGPIWYFLFVFQKDLFSHIQASL